MPLTQFKTSLLNNRKGVHCKIKLDVADLLCLTKEFEKVDLHINLPHSFRPVVVGGCNHRMLCFSSKWFTCCRISVMLDLTAVRTSFSALHFLKKMFQSPDRCSKLKTKRKSWSVILNCRLYFINESCSLLKFRLDFLAVSQRAYSTVRKILRKIMAGNNE